MGLDLSRAADDARTNHGDDPDVLIVQGDVMTPLFSPGIFNGGFSIDVLHHTPAPERGLYKLAKTVKRGGWVACCVYPRYSDYAFRSVARWRWLTNRISLGVSLALLYSHFSAAALAPLFQYGTPTWAGRLVTNF